MSVNTLEKIENLQGNLVIEFGYTCSVATVRDQKMSKDKEQSSSNPSRRIHLQDAIRVSSKTGRAYVPESDLLASEEFQQSLKRLREFRLNELNHSQGSNS